MFMILLWTTDKKNNDDNLWKSLKKHLIIEIEQYINMHAYINMHVLLLIATHMCHWRIKWALGQGVL